MNAIYITALVFSKQESIKNIFHLTMQLLFNEAIFRSEAVLKWMKAARIEKIKQFKPLKEEDSYDDESSEQEEIDYTVLAKFLKDVS